MITNKIKALLALKNKKNVELAKYLEMTPQSLRNKFTRGSFSAEDLIKIADFCNCKVVIEVEENQMPKMEYQEELLLRYALNLPKKAIRYSEMLCLFHYKGKF